ncbi:asparagine synthase (glutamine-hydrolyzing) [Vaginisenegalia massiliensis]|uniref:asparagine synthase (glutamine-hydrolyzing) n=1 Tax=Vaginisenegalia massiliensis TaxID=2058294 RepID=UPI000F51B6DD|nr:asparagine synthase (glutamine-hydrolyzing) [Vaginisenegalia massiliensis]
MCGIVGFVDQNSIENKEQIIKEMMDTIVHRGPNSAGQYVDEHAALGFRRLSIIDLEGGSQPIYNEDKSMVLTFNGEIYNFQSIREDLVAKGHIFQTHTDSEVLLHGYEEYGVELLKKLRGMFAFVIWDKNKQELFGARDHFGIKPLYYAQMNGSFIYGSEIKSLLKHPQFIKELNQEALKPYLTFQYSALDETFFKGVYRIKEGHYFTYKDGQLTTEKYWDMQPQEAEMTLDQTVDLIEKTVLESVETHKIADVEVGSFLSSGVDSSFVASVLRPNNTYSIGFGDHSYNESVEAKALTDLIDLKNTSRVVTGEEAFAYFPQIQYYLDEPDSNPSCVPLFFLAELASRDVRVVMSGEGADELFAGYQEYGWFSNSRAVRRLGEKIKAMPKERRYKLAKFLKKMPNFKGRRHLLRAASPAEDFFIGQAKVFEEYEADELLQAKYKQAPSVKEIVMEQFEKASQFSETKKMQYLDIHQWMPKDILLKADKMSMAHSLELRVPLLDKQLMEVAEKVPTKFLLTDENTKYAFRLAAGRHLPKEWSNRPKLGFPVPIKDWLHEEKFYQVVKTTFEKDFVKEFFDQDKILQLLEDNFHDKVDGRRKIWTLYTFLTWYDVYFEHNGDKPAVQTIA